MALSSVGGGPDAGLSAGPDGQGVGISLPEGGLGGGARICDYTSEVMGGAFRAWVSSGEPCDAKLSIYPGWY